MRQDWRDALHDSKVHRSKGTWAKWSEPTCMAIGQLDDLRAKGTDDDFHWIECVPDFFKPVIYETINHQSAFLGKYGGNACSSHCCGSLQRSNYIHRNKQQFRPWKRRITVRNWGEVGENKEVGNILWINPRQSSKSNPEHANTQPTNTAINHQCCWWPNRDCRAKPHTHNSGRSNWGL